MVALVYLLLVRGSKVKLKDYEGKDAEQVFSPVLQGDSLVMTVSRRFFFQWSLKRHLS
jgi:hypothetical protein